MRLLLTFLIAMVSLVANAQVKDLNTRLKPTMVLKISATDGANGSAVAWSPLDDMYYAVFAGNEEFPLTVFDQDGKEVQTTTTMADIRGFWYNPVYEFLEANLYEYHDIISYTIDEDNGFITDEEPYEELYELPILEPNAVVALDTDDELYIWFDSELGKVNTIDAESGEDVSQIELKIPVDLADINSTSVIYTEVKDAEYGLLDYNKNLIYLFNKRTGKNTATLKLPEDAPTYGSFNFSFTNGMIWLFDKNARQWIGYGIWK